MAYGTITAITLVFVVTFLKFPGDSALEELSNAYHYTLIYSQLMTQVAFWAYLPKMLTMYEFIIGELMPHHMAHP